MSNTFFSLAVVLLTNGASAVEYPGAAPGKASVARDGALLTARNAAIEVSWTLTQQGLKPAAIRGRADADVER